MKRLTFLMTCLLAAIVAFVICYWPSPLEAEVTPFPVKFICPSNTPLETQFCRQLYAALDGNAYITFSIDETKPHFSFIILPTSGDTEYISVMVASNFEYPPLNGLSLSAFLGSFLIKPGGCDAPVVTHISNALVTGSSRWLVANNKQLYRIGGDNKRLWKEARR